MTTELYWLTLTLLMTALFWLPYIGDRLSVRGFVPALTDTRPESGGPHSLWAQRAIRAHQNAVENLGDFCACRADRPCTAHLDAGDTGRRRRVLLRATRTFHRLHGRHSGGPHYGIWSGCGRAVRTHCQRAAMALGKDCGAARPVILIAGIAERLGS